MDFAINIIPADVIETLSKRHYLSGQCFSGGVYIKTKFSCPPLPPLQKGEIHLKPLYNNPFGGGMLLIFQCNQNTSR